MNTPMHLADYVDLEWFLDQDRSCQAVTNAARDRRIGLDAMALGLPRGALLDHWLQVRRREAASRLPSERLRAATMLLRWVLVAAGLCCGAGLCRGLLLYTGVEPVNVFVFLLVAVAPQVVLAGLGAWALVGPETMVARHFAPAWRLIRLGLRRVAGGARGAGASWLPSVLRDQGPYRSLVFWECVRLAHLGGTCFALGMLLMFCGSVLTLDLAFGWQSTLRVGPEALAVAVKGIAAPWAWLPLPQGIVPDLAQIEGSRIVLKDGIAALASADLTSWWPFLAMALLCYAVIPRVLLLVGAHLRLRSLERSFDHPALRLILDRMTAPVVADPPRPTEPPREDLPLHEAAPLSRSAVPGEHGCVLVVPEEVLGKVVVADFSTLAERLSGYPITLLLCGAFDDPELAARTAGLCWQGGVSRYLFVIEAWQPPIRELLLGARSFLDWEPEALLSLVLLGRPEKGTWLTTPTHAEVEVWTQAMARISSQIVVQPMENA